MRLKSSAARPGWPRARAEQPALESGFAILGRSVEQAADDRQRAGQVARFLVRRAQEPGGVGIART